MFEPWWVVLIAGAALAVIAALWRPARSAAREARVAMARRDFRLKREWLEAKFVQRAAARSQSGVVRWSDCEFADDVAYVRNRSTQELSAFVAVTVPVEDVDLGAPTEDLMGSMRIGTAIFRFDRDHWDTDGRAILNLTPAEAIRFYQSDLERIDQELAGHS
ncbi:MAG: hypothetical protein ACOY3P_05790 [Planctomycetota bacterium]